MPPPLTHSLLLPALTLSTKRGVRDKTAFMAVLSLFSLNKNIMGLFKEGYGKLGMYSVACHSIAVIQFREKCLMTESRIFKNWHVQQG